LTHRSRKRRLRPAVLITEAVLLGAALIEGIKYLIFLIKK